jgi:hypothetical protein
VAKERHERMSGSERGGTPPRAGVQDAEEHRPSSPPGEPRSEQKAGVAAKAPQEGGEGEGGDGGASDRKRSDRKRERKLRRKSRSRSRSRSREGKSKDKRSRRCAARRLLAPEVSLCLSATGTADATSQATAPQQALHVGTRRT